MNRYFTADVVATGQSLSLDAEIEKHAVKVLRQQVGDSFELVGADHRAFLVSITAVNPLTVQVGAEITKQVELPMQVYIACGVPKGDKAEWIVQKATEMGASTISFFNSQWATARWVKERVPKKLARLQAIAQGAAEQSHRNLVPTVSFVSDVAALTGLDAGAKLVAYEESAKVGEAATLVQTVKRHPESLLTVFGPEGGLAPEEVARLTGAGFEPAGLGPRIMRAETAPLYLLAALSTLTELDDQHD